MNLRVDLILESEQRSGSLLSPKSLIRIAIIILPTILGLVLATAAYKTWQFSAERKQIEEQLRTTSNRQAEASNLRDAVAENENMLKKMKWWHDTQLDWSNALLGIRNVVPDSIQLTALSISEKIGQGANPSRDYSMVLQGKAVGADAETNVSRLAEDIKKAPEFAELLESSKVTSFLKDSARGADEQDRVFRIECGFKPRI